VSSGSLDTREVDLWSEDETVLHMVVPPAHPQWERCPAVHCIEEGPWTQTLVCCTRKMEHEDEHKMTLGDVGAPEYWEESWV
jgi:hypothetical protein